MKITGWLTLGLMCGLGSTGCGDDPVAEPGDGASRGDGGEAAQSASPLDFAAYDAVVEAFIADKGLEGATTAVVHRDLGVVHVAGYGAFEPERLSLLASSSKILSVGVLMRLSDLGELDVDAPIANVLESAFGDGGDDKDNLTVAQLVSNSSGLPGLFDDPMFLPYICQYLEAGTLEDCAASIYTTTDDAAERVPADSMFRYGGGQWQLAGGVAEIASGKSWADLVQETYVVPCGVDSLGYANQFQKYGTDYPSDWNQDPQGLGGADNPSIEGGGYITPEDYGKLLLMHLRGGLCGEQRVLSEASVLRMQEDRIASYGDTSSPSLEGYGLGWWVDRNHEGVVVDGGAYGATPWLDTERGYGAIIILEAESALGAEVYAVAKPELDAVFDAL